MRPIVLIFCVRAETVTHTGRRGQPRESGLPVHAALSGALSSTGAGGQRSCEVMPQGCFASAWEAVPEAILRILSHGDAGLTGLDDLNSFTGVS